MSVRAVILDSQGRVLLLRRSAASKSFASHWELPGGKLDPGETPDQALRREVREETGLEVSITGLLGSSAFDLPHVRVANLFHSASVLSGSLRLSQEHEESLWADPQVLPTLDLAPTVSEFLKDWSPKRPHPHSPLPDGHS